MKYLIDTNIIIGLEDNREIMNSYSRFSRLAAKHKLMLLIHENSKADINRDKDESRRKISLSKIEKYQILKPRMNIEKDELERIFGSIKSDNDFVDASLVFALESGVVDFLVTQDKKLHNNVMKNSSELSNRILTIERGVEQIEQLYEPISDPILVKQISANEIDTSDSFFDDLKERYDNFDEWWKNKCVYEQHSCLVVYENEELAGMVVRKEDLAKKMRISIFVVHPNYQGNKLGELFLKKICWYAQFNNFKKVQIEVSDENQIQLINLLEYYGFKKKRIFDNNVVLYEKLFGQTKIEYDSNKTIYQIDRENYPRFLVDNSAEAFGVPIIGEYHDKLFPDMGELNQINFQRKSPLAQTYDRSGNTIRKVYICRAQIGKISPGSLMFFYRSKSKEPPSQSLTAIGILENFKVINSNRELIRETAGRSVYSKKELQNSWNIRRGGPVKIFNFILVSYINPPIGLEKLRKIGYLRNRHPLSIFRIEQRVIKKILNAANLNFEI